MDRSFLDFLFLHHDQKFIPQHWNYNQLLLRRMLYKSYDKGKNVKQFFVSRNKKKKFYQTLFPKIQSLSIYAQTTGSLSSFICIVFVVLLPCPFYT